MESKKVKGKRLIFGIGIILMVIIIMAPVGSYITHSAVSHEGQAVQGNTVINVYQDKQEMPFTSSTGTVQYTQLTNYTTSYIVINLTMKQATELSLYEVKTTGITGSIGYGSNYSNYQEIGNISNGIAKISPADELGAVQQDHLMIEEQATGPVNATITLMGQAPVSAYVGTVPVLDIMYLIGGFLVIGGAIMIMPWFDVARIEPGEAYRSYKRNAGKRARNKKYRGYYRGGKK